MTAKQIEQRGTSILTLFLLVGIGVLAYQLYRVYPEYFFQKSYLETIKK